VQFEFIILAGIWLLQAEAAFTPVNAAIGSETGRGIYPAGA
jgi:hypothetical protein